MHMMHMHMILLQYMIVLRTQNTFMDFPGNVKHNIQVKDHEDRPRRCTPEFCTLRFQFEDSNQAPSCDLNHIKSQTLMISRLLWHVTITISPNNIYNLHFQTN